MRFCILGPVTAYGLDGAVELGPTRQRTVLAVLLAAPGMPVTTDQLVDRVWGDQAPQRARQTLHTYLSRLRTALEAADGPNLVRRGRGYLLDVDPATVDLHRFRDLVGQARVADVGEAAELWREALALWRGTPFDDLDSDWLNAVAAGLERERWAAVLDRNDVLLRAGAHAALLADLTEAVDGHPLDERLAAQYLLALYAVGRQSDALAHYRLVRRRLVHEIGSEPGPALKDLHHRILHHDPHLVLREAPEPAEPAPQPPARSRRPAQLPADTAGFTGRADELDELDRLLDEPGPAIRIAVIGGTAGVGKTALAVHWAHRVSERFPDGQLYLNLRGYDPQQPMNVADALARLLVGLGVPDREIPVGVDDQAARFRSEIAGKRMILVLDNASTVALVRSLLPGSGSCLVVVTSRDSLAGLVAIDGAYRVDLALLSDKESAVLLGRLIGRRAQAEPATVALLAEQCARLPLALRVAAELAVSRPDSTLAELTAELTDRQSRLDLLDAGGDPYAAVGEVLSWSTQHLPAAALATFRLLGLHPGPDVDAYAVAALTGAPVGQARQSLALLARAYLVHRAGPGRFGLHDLLRAYAGQLAATELTEAQRSNAVRQLLDYYQTAAADAMDCLHPAEAADRPVRTARTAAVPDLSANHDAQRWLDNERFGLIAVATHAAAAGDGTYAVDLARIVHRYLIDAHTTEAITLNELARAAAERDGDSGRLAHALRQLGAAYGRTSRLDLAVDYQRKAVTLFQQCGDGAGQARTLTGLGVTLVRLGRHGEARTHMRSAVAVARLTGDAQGEAMALNNLGNLEQRLGHHADASDYLQQALDRFHVLGVRTHEANALTNLAVVETTLGRYAEAAAHLDESLTILKELSTPTVEAHTLDKLGMLLLRLGDVELATAKFAEALEIDRRTGVRASETYPLNGLAEAAFLAGDFDRAVDRHKQALAVAEEIGVKNQQARAHLGIGRALNARGDIEQARTHLETALALYEGLGMPEAAEAQQALAEMAPHSSTG
ncbi:tetratricopeptide repeat protein [Hamadaea sp. NPDC051192]|uniref:AfsR/SARP family transcriptional regulator n=1 Tax=Hamadaea sp. NPDC051192 TaxID=3154940 RepID=UPI0034382952